MNNLFADVLLPYDPASRFPQTPKSESDPLPIVIAASVVVIIVIVVISIIIAKKRMK